MFHTSRVWKLTRVGPSQLAHRLTEHTWCGCNGFRCEGLLWLNDSTSPDDLQEFAVVRARDRQQLESITASWSSKEKIEEYQKRLSMPGAIAYFAWKLLPTSIDCSENHRCGLCA